MLVVSLLAASHLRLCNFAALGLRSNVHDDAWYESSGGVAQDVVDNHTHGGRKGPDGGGDSAEADAYGGGNDGATKEQEEPDERHQGFHGKYEGGGEGDEEGEDAEGDDNFGGSGDSLFSLVTPEVIYEPATEDDAEDGSGRRHDGEGTEGLRRQSPDEERSDELVSKNVLSARSESKH